MKSVILTDFPSLGAVADQRGLAALFGRSRLANRMPPLANVADLNVPGPQFALYLAGAKMLTYYPVSIAVHSVALNITVQSYNGSLDYGLTGVPAGDARRRAPGRPDAARPCRVAGGERTRDAPRRRRESPRRRRAAPARGEARQRHRAGKVRSARRDAA